MKDFNFRENHDMFEMALSEQMILDNGAVGQIERNVCEINKHSHLVAGKIDNTSLPISSGATHVFVCCNYAKDCVDGREYEDFSDWHSQNHLERMPCWEHRYECIDDCEAVTTEAISPQFKEK